MVSADEQRITRTTSATCLAVGLATAGAQVLLLRELLVVSGGNELAAGVALTCWMMAAAVGSGIGGVVVRRLAATPVLVRKVTLFVLAAAGTCICLAMSLVGSAPQRWGPPVGELAAPHQVLAISVVVLFPACLTLGLLYPLLCHQAESDGLPPSRAAAAVFWLEALGFGAGGLLVGLALLPLVPAPLVAAGLCLVLLIAARNQWTGAARRPLAMGLMVVAAVNFVQMSSIVGRSPLGDSVVASRDTVHSRIEVLAEEGQHDVYVDGLWAFAFPDPEVSEWAAHPALLSIDDPADVLLVGGGVSGVLGQVLDHGAVRHVDLVEPDPGLIAVAREHLPPQATAPLDDERVRLHLTDGRAFVRDAEGPYDLVLLALPDPHSAQLNRFYTVEFFELVRDVLRDDGALAVGVTGSADMLGPNQARYVASVRAVMDEVFEQVVTLPGARTIVAGAVRSDTLSADPQVMARRMADRGLEPDHVTPFALQFDLGPMRSDYLRQVLDEAASGALNRDLRPRCFHHNTVLWATAQAPRTRDLLLRLEGMRLSWLLVALLAGAVLHALAARLRPTAGAAGRAALPAAVAVVGATGIVIEVVVILAYQVAFGHLFARIGLIIAAYMLGLALGARAIEARWVRPTFRTLMVVQVALVIGCAALAGVLYAVGVATLPGWSESLFAGVAALAGLAAGLHFPCAVRLRGARGSAGGLYAWDLAGAAIGSFTASIVLLPILGVPAVLVLLHASNLGAVLVLWACRVRGILPDSWDPTCPR